MKKMPPKFLYVAALVFCGLTVPGAARAQAAATVCKDGSTSATAGRGACSRHGGVNVAASKAEKKSVKSEEKAAAAVVKTTQGAQVTVTCGDGTTSSAKGRGACSRHGGVKSATATSKVTQAPIAGPATAPMRSPAPASASGAHSNATAHASARSAVAGSGAKEDNNPSGAVAKCKDGMYSHAAHRRGACSRHGGVGQWMGE